jgi:exodeoxyribonuclease VII large subunit
MGDMARKRLEIIAKLKEEGVFELNKELRIPLFAQRIAVISSAGAAGYGDFCNQLENNDYGFKFTTLLFPAIMQGEQVERSVIEAMNEVNRHVDDFDVLVIIRGGGATSDLSGFDTLSLAENVANFPLPVITGIGHERDESVLDMISNTKVKTPTAAAALLIDNLAMVYNRVCDAQTAIVNAVSRRIEMEHLRLSKLTESLPMLFSVVKSRNEMIILSLLNRASVASRMRINRESNHIDILSQQCRTIADRLLTEERHRIEMLCLRMEAVNPQHILERGYSITLFNGHALHDAKQVNNGDEIETRVEKGVVKSIIKK